MEATGIAGAHNQIFRLPPFSKTMSTPKTIIPPGSALHPQTSKGRLNLRVAIVGVLAFHAVLLGGLLIQGCNHQERKSEVGNLEPTNQTQDLTATPRDATTSLPTITNIQPVFEPPTPPPNPMANLQPLAPPLLPATEEYSVAKGDSYSKIARTKHIPIKALAAANPGADSTKLKVGQVLQLPRATGTEASSAPLAATPENHVQVLYVIKRGDTLTKIAKAHGTTVKALRAVNGLKTDTLVAGKTLKL
jgi:LysM repeat protein